ncbi:MAG: hemerythrin domain-containing protein [Dysgonamonadaceae bacterium]|jgi:regulator of cell morphogenesis and NO signaling|nr:hemerythrin domain-containing protein [Dysgonamonadaceae bacterium]
MNHNLFSEKMKVADLVLTNYRLLFVFPSFNLNLDLGERTVKQICEKNRISTSLFLLVCNLYTFNDYCPNIHTLAQIPLTDLMRYLKNSHKDYLENRITKVITRILDLIDSCCLKNGKILMKFCEKYRQEVITHFEYEEQVVFPYIQSLLDGEKTGKYKIKEYGRNHSDLDAALNDLKNILIKYLPPECSIEKCRDALIDLFLFEFDLSKHTSLEEQILIALVERIEK